MLHCAYPTELKGGRAFLSGMACPKLCCLFTFSTLINSAIMQLVIFSLQMIAAICLLAQCNSADGHFYGMHVQHRSPETLLSLFCISLLSLPPKHL